MRTADADDAILATGSLYVVGAARPALRRARQLTTALRSDRLTGPVAATSAVTRR